MTKAKRQYIAERLSTFDMYSFEESLNNLRNQLSKLQNDFFDYQRLRLIVEYNSEYPNLVLYGDRLETDKEFNKRLDALRKKKEKTKKEKEEMKAAEYQEYLKLKEKFEGKENQNE
jgi:hypothetical protein